MPGGRRERERAVTTPDCDCLSGPNSRSDGRTTMAAKNWRPQPTTTTAGPDCKRERETMTVCVGYSTSCHSVGKRRKKGRREILGVFLGLEKRGGYVDPWDTFH